MKRARSVFSALLLSVALSCALGSRGSAQPLPARSIENEGADAVLPGLEAFVDGLVASHMGEHVAGAQVAVVKDGRTLLVKGYGIASVAPERMVDPERSLFRLASISKIFTWLALMQLSDAGKLRLEQDVNAYLPRDLALPPDAAHAKVRVLDLMNHSAGFEEPTLLVDPRDETLLRSAREELCATRPARVRKPGRVFAYSNYGAELAGAIVAHVSGMDFESYVEQHIFAPLGMRHSTFRELYGPGAPHGLPAPMPPDLAADRASPLIWSVDRWRAEPHAFLLPGAPASAASSTASDMARYMIALLNPELLERAGVLRASAHAVFTRESFRAAPGLRGIHHGFFNATLGQRSKVGYANLSHGGNLGHFESFLSLVPELGLGTFVTTNSARGVELSRAVQEQLLRRYFPLKPAAARAPTAREALAQYEGDYRDLRRSYTRLEALFRIDDVLRIELGPGGCLMVPIPREGPACFVRIGPDLFEKVDGDARLAFLRDATGQITNVVGALNVERVGLVDSALWLRMWLALGLAVVLGVIVAALRRAGQPHKRPLGLRLAAWSTLLSAVAWLAFYVTGAAWHIYHGEDALRDYPQPLLVLGVRIVLGAIALTGLSFVLLPFVFRDAGWSLARRVRHMLVLFALLGLTLALRRWNVIDLRYLSKDGITANAHCRAR
jgi:CubicO group peptidase (beta-lactamase class C family)